MELQIIASAIFKQDHLYYLLEYDDDMFSVPYIYVMKAIRELVEQRINVSLATVQAKLQAMKLYGKAGGDKLIYTDIAQAGVAVLDFEFLVKELYNKNIRSKLMFTAKDLFTNLGKNENNIQKFVDNIMEFNEQLHKPKEVGWCTIQDLANEDIDKLFQKSYYVKTDIKAIDEKIVGFFKGQLIVIAARPKIGKSSLALQIAANINNTLFFSLEMKRQELYSRMLSRKAKVEAWKIESQFMNDEEKKTVLTVHEEMKNKIKMTVFDSTKNYSSIMRMIKKTCDTKNPKLIVIDYLQLMRGMAGENENIRIGNLTSLLKDYAGIYNIPIVLISQLSRDSAKEKREPVLSDLRGSGAIEADADVIIFLHEKDDKTYLIVAGNRKGKTGKIENINFVKQYTYFEDVEEKNEVPKFSHWTDSND